MAAASKKSSSTVFVGNIPYGTTEDQLREVFGQVGKVSNFRILYDKDTGKPKGFGFCEYEDIETAMSAIRNLNNVEVNGRQLRVDYTEIEKREMAAAGITPANVNTSQQQQSESNAVNTSQQNQSMKELSLEQIFDMMLQLKSLLQQNPEQLRSLLLSNPSLAHAVVMGQIMLGLMSTNVSNTMGNSNPNQAQQGMMMMPPPPSAAPMRHVAPTMGVAGMMGNVPGVPPQLMIPQGGVANAQNPNQAALLQQVMSLTPQQLEMLPPDQRMQVQQMQAAVKAQMMQQAQQSSLHRPPY